MDQHEREALYRFTWLAVALSLGHHLDHLIRGNAVGWPLTDQVNAFTISLGVYPVIATGLLAYRAGRVGPGFWALVSGGGAVFVGAVHFGPAVVEPPVGLWLGSTENTTVVTHLLADLADRGPGRQQRAAGGD